MLFWKSVSSLFKILSYIDSNSLYLVIISVSTFELDEHEKHLEYWCSFLKENISPIENSLDKIKAISGNTFDWKSGFEQYHSHTGKDVGVIAQEIQSILPEIVTERESGYLAVDYIKIIALLIEAIKEQQKQIDLIASNL